MSDPPSRFTSFVSELRRRHVFRVAGVYLVVGWALIEVAATVAEPLRLPAWTTTLVILLVGLGFPVALVLAWAFELTPEGLQRTESAPGGRADAREGRSSRLGPGIGIGVVAAVVALGAYTMMRRGGAPSAASGATPSGPAAAADSAGAGRSRPSIVVLPFENLSDEKGSGYFTDGVVEEITAALAEVSALDVKSRTSAMHYRGSHETVPQIARELGADYVLEGSVRQAARQIRITVQLIDAKRDEHLWAQSYDREASASALFSTPADIARIVASALEARLTPAEEARIGRRPTENMEAYTLYTMATAARSSSAAPPGRDARAMVEEQTELLRRAIALDPRFALAEVALSRDFLMFRTIFGDVAYLDSADAHLARTFAVDSTLPEAWEVKAQLQAARGDVGGETASLQRVLELRPSSPSAIANLAMIHLGRGDYDLAMEYARHAYRLEPTEPERARDISQVYATVGAFEPALRWLRAAVADRAVTPPVRNQFILLNLKRGDTPAALANLDSMLDPVQVRRYERLPAFWELVGSRETQLQLYDSAAVAFERQRSLLPPHADVPFLDLAFIERRRGASLRADSLLSAAEALGRARLERDPVGGHDLLGLAAAVRGDTAGAVTHLRAAARLGWDDYYAARVDPRLKALEGYAPYDSLMSSLQQRLTAARQRIVERFGT